MDNIPPEVQQKLVKFQQIQQQGQLIGQQRQQMELQLGETSRTIEEVDKLTAKSEVYKSVGALLIKSKKAPLSKELKERKETLELRVNALKKQEEKLKSTLTEMQASIQESLKSAAGGEVDFTGA